MISPDPPIAYIQRTRDYYLALGYPQPYRWPQYDDVPFQPLDKPLSRSRVAIVTTAAFYQPGKGDQGPGAAYNAAAKFYAVYSQTTGQMPDLRISHIAIDRDHTTGADIGGYFPLAALRRAAADGPIGDVAPRFHGLPTNRSQETTVNVDAAELLQRCRTDAVDAAVLVPNCPICHQSTALAARVLEAGGVATVIMGCGLDIVEHIGVPRYLFSDLPLGNSAGRPDDPASQDRTLAMALDLLEQASAARTTARSDLRWRGAADWKLSYANAALLSADELARRRASFDDGRFEALKLREELKQQ